MDMDIDLDQLRALMEAAREFNLQELEITRGERRIVIKRGGGSWPMLSEAPPLMSAQGASLRPTAEPAAAMAANSAPAAAAVDDANTVYITSPFVGTFYRSPTPDAAPYLEVGQRVRAGQVICIVEAMKLMNEIESEVDGIVEEALMENGKPVEFGDRLYRVSLQKS